MGKKMTMQSVLRIGQVAAEIKTCLITNKKYNGWKESQGIGELEVDIICAEYSIEIEKIFLKRLEEKRTLDIYKKYYFMFYETCDAIASHILEGGINGSISSISSIIKWQE